MILHFTSLPSFEYIAFASINGVTLFNVNCATNGYGIFSNSILFRNVTSLKTHEKTALHSLMRGCAKQNWEKFSVGFLTANNEGVKSRFGHGWSRIVTTRDHPDSIHLFSEEKRKET